MICQRPAGKVLSDGRPVSVEEVSSLLKRLQANQCSLDPVPAWLLKRISHLIVPVITRICNTSFCEATLPTSQIQQSFAHC